MHYTTANSEHACNDFNAFITPLELTLLTIRQNASVVLIMEKKMRENYSDTVLNINTCDN